MVAEKIGVIETVLHNAHQSLIATKMSTEEVIPILSGLNKAGLRSLKCWGGATFDTCLRFLNESPWDRPHTIRRLCPKTKLQTLFRGQNMLGYRHYADGILDYFVQRSVANGIDVIHIFDALNNLRNLERAIKTAKKEGAHAQVDISYTTDLVFTNEYYIDYVKRVQEAGADPICTGDMAALLTPCRTGELIRALKSAVDLPTRLRTHYTSGLASVRIIKGVKADVDQINTAILPLTLNTSHAPTESVVTAFESTEYDTGLDPVLFNEIREYFMTLRKKYIQSGLLDLLALATNTKALHYQVPGGMLPNLLSQLKQTDKADQLEEVLQEAPHVHQDFDYPPLVTPTFQVIGTQAVFNVVTGERYKMCTKEFKDMVAGKYGKTPVEVDSVFQKEIIGDRTPITCRPADLLSPELETLREETAQWVEQEEDTLSYAQSPEVAEGFLRRRRDAKYGINNKSADGEKQVHPI